MIAFLFSWNDFFYSWLISSGSPAETYNTFLSVFLGGATAGSAPQPNLFAAAVAVQIFVVIVIAASSRKDITSLKIVDPGTVAQ